LEEPSRPRARPRRWPAIAAVVALVAAGLNLAIWNVRLPFYAFSGGPVGDAVDSVEVSGVDTFTTDGELLMLTVSSQEVNPFEALIAGLDPDVDLVAREAVRSPDETDEEFVARNQANMDLSKQTAISLALTRLGYEVVARSEGVLVADVVADAPAASTLQVDDVIVAVDGRAVELPDQIGPLISPLEVGETISLDIVRDGRSQTVEVELAAREDDPTVPMIGITATALHPRFEFPFPVDIDAGLIGGPSAGMMYTLAVMEVLTPADLTHGTVVAGTGTIDSAGNVGGIGGVRQKVVAAEAAGAAVMLVPAANYDEALTARRQHLELIPVSTLDEALAALEAL
jgi:PDZ domain-containing protein